jgi:16S rRNA (guanine(966)-N(2))-methyltransferase RsmD
MRIYGNRLLKTLPGLETRPTPARVREALFNIWQGRVQGCAWLDLCTGSGAMGAEALCRGAAVVIGIEQSSNACRLIQDNWQRFAQPEQQFQVLRGDVLQRLKSLSGQTFDLIYFDPPYASNLYLPVLEAIATHNLLAPTGEIAAEFNPRRSPTWQQTSFSLRQIKIYGNTALVFLLPTVEEL